MNANYLLLSFLISCSTAISAQNLDSLSANSMLPNELPATEQDLEISSSTTTISSEEIMERGYDNLDELLSSVQGIYISHDRTLTQIGIRGPSPTIANNQRVQVLLDGVPLNNPISGQAPSGYDLRGINMEDIKEVIIIRNPSAVENGNNAMLGVIKINTKKTKKGGRLNFDTGSYGELDGGFSIGQTFGKTTIGLSGRLANIQGQELYFPQDSFLDKESSEFGGGRLRVRHGKFSLNAFYNQREESTFGLESDPILRFDDFDTTMVFNGFRGYQNSIDTVGKFKEKQLYIDLSFSTPIKTNQEIDVRVFVNYENQEREQYFQDDVFEYTLDTVVGIDSFPWSELNYFENPKQKNLWIGLGYQHTVRLTPNHQLKFGTDLLALPFTKFENNLKPTFYIFVPDNESTTTDFPSNVINYLNLFSDSIFLEKKFFDYWSTGFFIQDQIRLNEIIAVSGGVRLNINSQTKPIVAPELNFIFTPFSEKTNIQLGFRQGFRLPSILETNVSPVQNGATSTRDFTPEKVNNFELGWMQKIGKDLNLNLTLFHQRMEDLVWNENTTLPTQPDSTITSTGLEGGLGMNLTKGIKTYFNYNFQLGNNNRVNLPSPLCKFGVTIPFLKHFTLFTEGQYEGARLGFDGTYTLPYFLMNTNLLIRPKVEAGSWLEGLSFAFRLYNALDEFYQHPSAQAFSPSLIPQNGRTWQTQLTYQF